MSNLTEKNGIVFCDGEEVGKLNYFENQTLEEFEEEFYFINNKKQCVPFSSNKKTPMTAAERKAKQRANSGLCTFSVDLPRDLVEKIGDFMKFKNMTRNEVFKKLVENQLLRKR